MMWLKDKMKGWTISQRSSPIIKRSISDHWWIINKSIKQRNLTERSRKTKTTVKLLISVLSDKHYKCIDGWFCYCDEFSMTWTELCLIVLVFKTTGWLSCFSARYFTEDERVDDWHQFFYIFFWAPWFILSTVGSFSMFISLVFPFREFSLFQTW